MGMGVARASDGPAWKLGTGVGSAGDDRPEQLYQGDDHEFLTDVAELTV